jgi:arsenate reductase (thioredoxin)
VRSSLTWSRSLAARIYLGVMKEVGIDLNEAKLQKLTDELARQGQLLITMGCGDKYPYVPGLGRDDWPLPDRRGAQRTG